MFKIAISGKKKTGKDTLCKVMVDLISDRYSSFEVKSLSFADPIKKIVSILFPQIPKAHLYGASELRNSFVEGLALDGKNITVRDLLIDVGESYKKYNKDLFIDIFHNKSQAFLKDYLKSKFLIATDVRFPQEFDYVKKEGFITIRIQREGVADMTSQDVTETAQEIISSNKFDYIVDNNGTVDSLKQQALKIFNNIV